ncbi:MAG: dTMP kinase, partial [Exiguobacterium sp.]
MKGTFITVEGPDGAGKTTQLQLLNDVLKEKGYNVMMTREPGGTRVGNEIRSLILNPDFEEMKEMTEILLYAASRAQHVEELIRPALEAGTIILCDRFVDASLAYQGYG